MILPRNIDASLLERIGRRTIPIGGSYRRDVMKTLERFSPHRR